MRVAIFALFTFRGSAMKEMRTLLLVCSVVLPIAILAAQAPDPSRLGNYPDAWPTHYGDHSGRRYSPLAQINLTNVKTLSLAWIHRATAEEGRERRRRASDRRSLLLGRAAGERDDQGDAADGRRRAVFRGPRPRIRHRCAHRQGHLALLLAYSRRHPYRQPRRRHVR